MPVYDYKCAEHGLFHQLATFEQSAEPQACPSCGQLAARVIVLPPELKAMSRENHTAHERNETSQHQPVFSTTEARADAQERQAHAHRKGKPCGCHDGGKLRSALMYTADGKKMFPSMRPWMISH